MDARLGRRAAHQGGYRGLIVMSDGHSGRRAASRDRLAGSRDHPQFGHRRSVRLVVAALVALVVLGFGAGSAYALMSRTGASSDIEVRSGDLDLELGQVSWRQTTPGVDDPASGLMDATPMNFDSMPGDVIMITAPVTTILKGDNLQGALLVDYEDAEADHDDVSITYHVEDTEGHQVAPATGELALGQPAIVPGLVGRSDNPELELNVVVRAVVGGTPTWLDADGVGSGGLSSWTVGTLSYRLIQVREGPGFVTGG